MEKETMPATWLIWSRDHGGWWRPCTQGYTADIMEAGVYGTGVAVSICIHASLGGKANECMVPARVREHCGKRPVRQSDPTEAEAEGETIQED